jgi:hypothetical protein
VANDTARSRTSSSGIRELLVAAGCREDHVKHAHPRRIRRPLSGDFEFASVGGVWIETTAAATPA